MALFKHRITGQIINAPAHYEDNPILGKNLIPVEAEFPHAEKKQNKKAQAALPEVESQQGETLIIENEEN